MHSSLQLIKHSSLQREPPRITSIFSSLCKESQLYLVWEEHWGSIFPRQTCQSKRDAWKAPCAIQTSTSLKTIKCLNPCIINDVPKSLLLPSGVLNHLNFYSEIISSTVMVQLAINGGRLPVAMSGGMASGCGCWQ